MLRRILIFGFFAAVLPLPARSAGVFDRPVGDGPPELPILSPRHYDLEIDVQMEERTLRGTARIRLRNSTGEPTERASFLLYRLLRATAARDGERRPVRYAQRVTTFDDFEKLQVNHVVVALPEPLPPGEETVIELEWEGHLLGYAETGMLYVRDRIDPEFTILRRDAYAYPVVGVPSLARMRSTPLPSYRYEARITVPPGLTVANGGRPGPVERREETATWTFESLEPSWRMDFAIADYGLLTRGPIRIYHLPGDEEGAAGVARAAEAALELFREWFGEPRGSTSLTFIEIPDGWGSQKDATTVIQTAAAFRDPTRHREVYHELSHIWNVPPTDRPSPRWDEGLASFVEYVATEQLTGEPVVDARADRLLEWLREEVPDRPRWREVPLIEYGESRLTDLSYSVGALFFDLLYRVAGPGAFREAIATYHARFAESGGSTEDLLAVIRETSPAPVHALIDDWVRTTGWVARIRDVETIEELAGAYRTGGMTVSDPVTADPDRR